MRAPKEFCQPRVAQTVKLNTKPPVLFVAVFLCVCQLFTGCRKKTSELPRPAICTPAPELAHEIELFCGDCHAAPRAESFPRVRWHEEVRIGYQQYARSGRNDLTPPPMAAVIDFYRQRAPETLEFKLPENRRGTIVQHFLAEDIDWNPASNSVPAIAGLLWSRLEQCGRPHLIVSDMREGTVTAVDFSENPLPPRVLARLEFPSRVEPCDLNESGRVGFVVAELGSFFAVDHDRGKVLWLKNSRENGEFEVVPLVGGLGRVADVRVADFDDDGDQDIVVAEFGHYHTGGILLLENPLPNNNSFSFVIHRLDQRTGTIHVPILDFNQDGRPDFAALISNESESLDLFVNLGQKKFLSLPVWRAPDLTFGSSGIEVCDLDGDGDLDVLYTNGDTFDNLYANPSHGLQWLENTGENGFQYHRLEDLPGAYRALAADFDKDGDLDIALSSWLPRNVKPPNLRKMRIPSILLLEQTASKEFRTQILDADWPQYPVLLVADLDGDGDLDLVAGRHSGLDDSVGTSLPRLRVWWNQKIPGRTPKAS